MNFLTEEECQELKLKHRQEKNRRKADRIKAVLLANKGWNYRQIADALLLDEDTVSTHVNEYISEKKLEIESGGSESKLSSEQTEKLIVELESKIYLKVIEICGYVEEIYDVKYTVAGMTSWLQRNNFTYRKPHGAPAKANVEEQKEFIEKYENLKKMTPKEEPILFLDGVHPTMATKISYGWIKKKSNKTIETTGSRTRMNIVGAINLDKMQLNIKNYKTINSESMIDYFEFLKTCYPKAPKIHVILDQGSYNTSKLTTEFAAKNNIILHHLPAHSPNLNSIERLWKVMNEKVRNNVFFESAKKFKKDILDFFDKTWDEISESMKSRINDNFHLFTKPIISV